MKILLICGESGVGKSTIAYELSKNDNYSLVRSITDRPKRAKEIDHIFVEKDMMDHAPVKEIVAYTKIDGYRYCTLFRQFDAEKINIYVVDALGLKDVRTAFPKADIASVLIKRDNVYIDATRKNRSIQIPTERDVTFTIKNNTTIKDAVDLIKDVCDILIFKEESKCMCFNE